MKIIWHWLILSLAVFVAAYLLPARIQVEPAYMALVVGACLMFVNMTIKPIIKLLTLPINLVTLGLFSVVINGVIFYLLAVAIKGFSVSSFLSAVIGSIIVSLINWLLGRFF